MTTPESVVYNKREGSGAAQIFGQPGQPVRALMLRKQDALQRQRVAEAEAKLAKDKRDQKMFEILAVSPEKTFQPFDDQVRNVATEHRKKVEGYFNAGGDPNNPSFQSWNKGEWDRINGLARKGIYIQDKIKATMDTIKQNPYLKTDYYYPKIFDHYMDAHGNGKPLDQVNVNDIESIYQTDPGGFDMNKYTNDFLANIKDNVFNYVKKRNTAYGTETDDVEVKTKGALYTPDAKTTSGVQEDEFGNPILKISNEVLNSFADSPNAQRAVEHMAQQTGQDPRQVMSELIQNNMATRGGGFSRNVKPTSKMLPWTYYQNNNSLAGIKQQDIPRATQRLRNIGNIMNAFWNEDGTRRDEPSPEAVQALNYIAKNTKFGDGEVLEATFLPGSTEPGKTAALGAPVDNSPNDRIAFKVKFSDRGSPKVQTVDLDEQTAPALNSIFETSKTEGGYNVGYDQLLNLNQELGGQIFNSRIDRSHFNKQRAEIEQQQVSKWKNMEDLDQLNGKVLAGKKITSASKKPGTYWWSDDKISVTLEDGSKAEIDPNDPESYKTLSKLYNQGAKKKGESGIEWK
jgi:hypothetical protein